MRGEGPYRSAGDGDDVERDEVAVDGPENGPVVRLANLLLLEAIDDRVSFLRFDPSDGRVLARRADAWEPWMELPSAVRAPVARRLRLMAGLPPGREGEASFGWVLLLVSAREHDIKVFVRPHPGRDVVVLRALPDPERAQILRDPGDPAVLAPLRWDLEHALRLARSPNRRAALAPLDALLGRASELGRDGSVTVVKVAWALSEASSELGETALALDALRRAHEHLDATIGGGPAMAEVLGQRAALLDDAQRPDEARADVGEAIEVARSGFALDPLVAALHLLAARIEERVGRVDAAAEQRERAIDVLTALSGAGDLEVAEIRARPQG